MIFSTFKILLCLSVLSDTGSLSFCPEADGALCCFVLSRLLRDTSLEMAVAWCVLGGCHLHALSFPALSCLGAIGSLPSCLPAACWGRSWVFILAGGTAYKQRLRAAIIATKQAKRPAQASPYCWQHVLSKPRTCSHSGLLGASAHVLLGKPQANLFHWIPSPSSLPNAFQPWPCPASCAIT